MHTWRPYSYYADTQTTQIQVQFQIPVIHEVLVFTEVKQARERCLSSEYNRGREAALTALEMIKVMRRL